MSTMPDYKRLFVFPTPIFASLAMLLILLLVPAPCSADSRVCLEGCEHSTIAAALNASAPGETITVYSGVYSQPLLVSKRVVLHGLDTGEGKPRLTPQGGQLVLAAYGAVLRGFKIDAQKAEASDARKEEDCSLEVALPAMIFLNQFSGRDIICPVDAASWNSSQKMNYQYNSRVLSSRMGNYWADYKGKDENGDGIGDEPVILNEKNIDYHPLIRPMEEYRISDEKEPDVELIRAKVGENFTVSLPSNPSTGYVWTMDYDYVLLRAQEAQFEQADAQAIRPGSGGSALFVFTPLCSGKTTIRFVYKRPWENIVADTRAFLVDISG